ncbi:MAG: arylsulfatase [Bacteroidales bacterium]|nr:arylsulfatase [Bacteroidales bacterium]
MKSPGLVIFLFLILGISACSVKQDQPNVILIMTDDQGYGDLGAHGSPYVITPNLDKLYDECVRFTDFHVDPCCAPTRAALLTGCYSLEAGVWHTIGGRSLLKEEMPTIADLFTESGYETGIFGKWHLGENFPFRPMDRGFSESIVHGGGGVGGNPGYWGNDYYDDTYVHNGEYEKYEGSCNTVWFSEALKYIRQNKNKPFFCYISTNVPHAPLRVDEKYVEPYKDKVSDRLAHYYGMVTKVDEDIATLLKEIDELGLKENTILIFMTDNGPCPWFGGIDMDFETGYPLEGFSAGMRGGKIWGYENAHRVPFYIRWPAGGIGGGKDINAISAHIDLMPTLIDLCRLDTPERLTYDGQSLAPLLNGEIDEWPERAVITHNQRVEFVVKDKEYQVMTERWRLVKREKDELYDIITDPGQHNNVVNEYPEVVKDLYMHYEKWWEENAPGPDWYANIYVGTEYENPVTLYSHDSFSRQGQRIWVLNVARDGKYEIRLNRWPEESGKRIIENAAGDKELPIVNAEIRVGNINRIMDVTQDMTSAKFIIDLKAGTTCLHTSLNLAEEGKTSRTDCVYVKYLGEADADAMSKYIPSVPDEVLRKNYKQKVPLFD